MALNYDFKFVNSTSYIPTCIFPPSIKTCCYDPCCLFQIKMYSLKSNVAKVCINLLTDFWPQEKSDVRAYDYMSQVLLRDMESRAGQGCSRWEWSAFRSQSVHVLDTWMTPDHEATPPVFTLGRLSVYKVIDSWRIQSHASIPSWTSQCIRSELINDCPHWLHPQAHKAPPPGTQWGSDHV